MARRRLLAVLAGAVLLAGCVAPPERDILLEWLDATPATSRPQEFFTFGGQDAGPLLGFTAVTAVGSTIVIVGDSVQATDSGVVQTPALFVGTVGGEWRRIDLPVPTASTGLRHATGVACAGTTCWVAGWAKNPIVWEVSLADGSVGPTTAFSGNVAGADDPSALITIVDGRPLVVTNGRLRRQPSCVRESGHGSGLLRTRPRPQASDPMPTWPPVTTSGGRPYRPADVAGW